MEKVKRKDVWMLRGLAVLENVHVCDVTESGVCLVCLMWWNGRESEGVW